MSQTRKSKSSKKDKDSDKKLSQPHAKAFTFFFKEN
jgi:hypothetical protein